MIYLLAGPIRYVELRHEMFRIDPEMGCMKRKEGDKVVGMERCSYVWSRVCV